MKAYLEAKTEAAKTNLISLPERLKTWQEEKWSETKHKLNTTDWPVTITHFVGWSVTTFVKGALLGMGAFAFLTLFVVWDGITKRDLGDGPVPMNEIYEALQNWFVFGITFAGAGVIACLVLNLHKLRLHRLDGHGPKVLVIDPTDDEAAAMVRAILDRQKKPRVS